MNYFSECEILNCPKCCESKRLGNKYYNSLDNVQERITKLIEETVDENWSKKWKGLWEKYDKIQKEFIALLSGRCKCCCPSWMIEDYRKAHKSMEYTKYTVAVVLRCKDKLWMSQRINTVNFQGKWQFPGGKLDRYENPFNGGIRELKEETNLDIGYERFKYLDAITGDPTTKKCFVYCVDLNEAEIPVRTENKMTDWVLMTYDEALEKDLMPGLKDTIENLKKEK